MDFLLNLDPFLRAYWYVAIPVSVIFLIQTVMTFVGVDANDGTSADFDSDLTGTDTPFQLFSFRNLINFLLGFSWTGISLYGTISNVLVLLVISVFVGILFVLLFFFIIKQVLRLSEDNTFNVSKVLNKTAEVYLTIPEAKTGKGKILISVGGSVHELDAMTENEKIPSGAAVKVIKIENNDIIIVQKI